MRYIQGMEIDGIRLQSPDENDAEAIISLMKQVMDETPYLACSSEEFDMTVEDERRFLRARADDPRDTFIAAWSDGAPIGTVSVRAVGAKSRERHRSRLGICLLRAYWGRGVGTRMMETALELARDSGFLQLELEVDAENQRAIALYRRFGFEEYGRLPGATRRDGQFFDELLMVKSLR